MMPIEGQDARLEQPERRCECADCRDDIHRILRTADELIGGYRADDYGEGPATFPVIANLWRSFFGYDFHPTDVAVAMILVKVARLRQDPTKADSWADIAGYAALGADAAGAKP